jgi:hypothetical protein
VLEFNNRQETTMDGYEQKLLAAVIAIAGAISVYGMLPVPAATAQPTVAASVSATPYFPDGYVNRAQEAAPEMPTF